MRTQDKKIGTWINSLSIVIPAYNEESRIEPTLRKVCAFLKEQQLETSELIVVDDGSADGTVDVVEQYRSQENNLRLLRNGRNRGKGYSVRTGMLAAQGDWILSTDADLSTPVEETVKLCKAAIESDAEVAIGSRALDRSLVGVRQPLIREAAGRLFNGVMRLVTGMPFRDTQCGFKLFRQDAARDIFTRQRFDGFSFDVEDLFLAQRLAYRCVEVPVRWDNALGSKVSFGSGMAAFTDLVRILYWHSGRLQRSARQQG